VLQTLAIWLAAVKFGGSRPAVGTDSTVLMEYLQNFP
jgi:hypothetical protein